MRFPARWLSRDRATCSARVGAPGATNGPQRAKGSRAPEGVRTLDIQLGKLARYQLRYGRAKETRGSLGRRERGVKAGRMEPRKRRSRREARRRWWVCSA